MSYLGLNPKVHQSGEGPPRYGRISKQGRSHARAMLVEAAWRAVRGPGPLRAFYERITRRRGVHIAAVAVARKLAAIIWNLLGKGEDYAWVRPALHARKLRDLELRSGQPARRGQRGPVYAYSLAGARQEERRRGEQAYRCQTEGGFAEDQRRPRVPQRRSDAEGCAAGLSPAARLFAARSPVSRSRIAPAHASSTVQLHPGPEVVRLGWLVLN